MIAPDPLKTEEPLTTRGRTTYDIIAARLATLKPPIFIQRHIAQSEQQKKTQFSTLETHDSTLDGINFRANDPKLLAKAFDGATDKWGEKALASMKEDPDHWALKISFGRTPGTGWREEWREAPYDPPGAVPEQSGKVDDLFRMRFGTAGTRVTFTALHCAVDEIGGKCNVHIDESGFVIALPKGFALTADLYGHIINELKFKTDFRDWLAGKMPNEMAARIVRDVIRRISIDFPNAANGYAGLDKRINSIRRPQTPIDLGLTAARLLAPLGVTADVYDNDYFKVQVTYASVAGERTFTLSVGGDW